MANTGYDYEGVYEKLMGNDRQEKLWMFLKRFWHQNHLLISFSTNPLSVSLLTPHFSLLLLVFPIPGFYPVSHFRKFVHQRLVKFLIVSNRISITITF